jgi:hypothetical protein
VFVHVLQSTRSCAARLEATVPLLTTLQHCHMQVARVLCSIDSSDWGLSASFAGMHVIPESDSDAFLVCSSRAGVGCWGATLQLLYRALCHIIDSIRTSSVPLTLVPRMMTAAMLFGAALTLRAFAETCVAIRAGPDAEALASALPGVEALCDIFALTSLQRHALLPLLDAGSLGLGTGSSTLLDAAVAAACTRARRFAVPLTDAFLLRDEALGSVLIGPHYAEALLQWAAREPSNTLADPVAQRDLVLLRRAGAVSVARAAASARL